MGRRGRRGRRGGGGGGEEGKGIGLLDMVGCPAKLQEFFFPR